MRLPWQRRDGDVDTSTPSADVPSDASTGRLADRLQREIEDLRSGLTDDLLLTLMLLGEDAVDEAVGVLDDGSERLQRFQDQVEDAVADAAVERDAEAVLAAAAVPDERRRDQAGDVQRGRGTAFRIRALASVAAAALAAVVAVVSVEPSEAPELVAASASSEPATSGPAAPGASAGSSRDRRTDATGASSAEPAPTERGVTPGDRLEALRIIGDQGGILARLGSEPRRSAVAALFGVERLIGQIVADAGDVLPSETVDAVEETISELELPPDEPSSEPTSEDAPADEPAEEPSAPEPTATEGPTATEEPTEDPSEEDPSEASDDPDAEPSEGTSADTTGPFSGVDSDQATATDGSGLL